MRVITGFLRGRRLPSPSSGVRPTPERVREAIFSILFSRGQGGEGSLWLDLFCGTGGMGIEAISRGAELVVFVDCSWKNLRAIEGFLERVGVRERGWTVQAYLPRDLHRLPLPKGRPYDLVFADPPFHWDRSPIEILDAPFFLQLTHPETLVIWESPFPSPEIVSRFWRKVDERRYGRVLLRFLMREE